MARALPVILVVALFIYALVDCAMTPADRVPRGLAKPLWIVLILVPVIGPVAWLFISRMSGVSPYRRGLTSGWEPARPSRPRFTRPRRPVAPDDDESFLADLDWQARKAHFERQRRAAEAAEQEAKKRERKARGVQDEDLPERGVEGPSDPETGHNEDDRDLGSESDR
ncbi:MAG: PLD nuclease N-terminal domain-containing protein [Bowdeniella nasicola]|nr:PLD nuclease N-terminal domain-containing protein [Bowdeniella nasicola]